METDDESRSSVPETETDTDDEGVPEGIFDFF
jgi:hypothetical protein